MPSCSACQRLLALIIGVPMGLYQAVHHGTLRDDVVAGTWFTLYSAPDFMEALLLIAIFSVHFHMLQPTSPAGSRRSAASSPTRTRWCCP